jgi:hypothetical protein
VNSNFGGFGNRTSPIPPVFTEFQKIRPIFLTLVAPLFIGGRVGFQNSLSGVISSSNASLDTGLLLPRGPAAIGALKLVLAPIPRSMNEFHDLLGDAKKFGFTPTKVLTIEGAEVELIRDGDHLHLVSDYWVPDTEIPHKLSFNDKRATFL